MITAIRVVKEKHAPYAFTGEGSRRFGGRWNHKGVAVVYLSDTLSLAALGGIREVLGTGFFNLYGYGGSVFGPSFEPFTFVIQAPGAFVCLGLMLCIMNLFEQ